MRNVMKLTTLSSSRILSSKDRIIPIDHQIDQNKSGNKLLKPEVGPTWQ